MKITILVLIIDFKIGIILHQMREISKFIRIQRFKKQTCIATISWFWIHLKKPTLMTIEKDMSIYFIFIELPL